MPSALLEKQARRLYPWLTDKLIWIYTTYWEGTGDPDRAWAEMQAHPEFERTFPGIKRDDGTLRMTAQEYVVTMEGYENVLQSVGLNPKLFRSQFVELIEGEVSPDEFAVERVDPLYERIVETSPGIMEWYSQQNGLALSFEAILAAALDPDDVGTKILNRQIGMAEIGGEGIEAGFAPDVGLVEELYERGVTREQAQQEFATAANYVPVLSMLARRHADPDDEFDLEEFVAADVFNDPMQRRRMRRLMQQERASFTGGRGTFTQDRETGGVVGLTER
jgi:hypothetical protein